VNDLSVDSINKGIYELMTNKKLREELSLKGLENSKRFALEDCAINTLRSILE